MSQVCMLVPLLILPNASRAKSLHKLLNGLSYRYRGALIDCMKGGHICRLTLDRHPFIGMAFGTAGMITPLINLWSYEGWLPDYMSASPKLGR
jgi:hypothetical protein